MNFIMRFLSLFGIIRLTSARSVTTSATSRTLLNSLKGISPHTIRLKGLHIGKVIRLRPGAFTKLSLNSCFTWRLDGAQYFRNTELYLTQSRYKL